MAFNQFAQGKFTIDVTGPYHCGPDHTTPKTFDFEVALRYHEDALDERGFLIDNTHFRQYFNALGTTDLSCERLVRKASQDFYGLVQDRCLEIRVAIWAIPNGARVEHVLVPEKKVNRIQW